MEVTDQSQSRSVLLVRLINNSADFAQHIRENKLNQWTLVTS